MAVLRGRVIIESINTLLTQHTTSLDFCIFLAGSVFDLITGVRESENPGFKINVRLR